MFRTLSGVLAVVTCVALALLARDQSASFKACASQQREAYAAQQQVKGAADVSFPIIERWPIRLHCTGTFIDENNAAITAVATLVIAVFTVVLTVVTSKQASLTKESLIADKRAFVFAANTANFWSLDKNTGEYNWHFRANWQNSGETPTKNMRMFAECEVRTSVLPKGFDFDTATSEPGRAFIPPKSGLNGGQTPTPPRAPVTPQDIVDAQAGRKFIYMWGWAKYYDVFPNTPEHITRFCWMITAIGDPTIYDPKAVAPDPGSLKFSVIYQTEGNCADDECG